MLVAFLVGLGSLAAALWTSPVQWKPDSLFYQAHVYQVRGDSHAVAYRKVFAGPLSLPRREGDAGLPLELRERLRDRRRRVARHARHLGDRPAAGELAEEAQPAEVEHR